jgi:hypothetical protein
MVTRGVTSNETPSPDEPVAVAADVPKELDAILDDLQIPDDVLQSIQKLPATAAELQHTAVDLLSRAELQNVWERLRAIPPLNAAAFSAGTPRTTAQYLEALANRFGEAWATVHARLCPQIPAPMEPPNPKFRQRWSDDSIESQFDFSGLETILLPYRAGVSAALGTVQTATSMPSRERLIFLSDADYAAVKEYFAAIHPPTLGELMETEGATLPVMEYMVGALKETTAALEEFYDIASSAQLFVERIAESEFQMIPRGPHLEGSDEQTETGAPVVDFSPS